VAALSAPSQYPPSGRAWWAVGVLILAFLIGYIDRQIIIFVADDIKASLGLTDFQIGQLQGFGITVFLAVAALPMGWAIDRYHRRNLLVLSMAGWIAATMWTATAGSYGSLFASRVGLGIAEACLYPALVSLLADMFPPSRRASSNLIVFVSLNVVLGLSYAIGGNLVAQVAALKPALPAPLAGLETWRLVFVAVALPIPFAALLLLTCAEPTRKEQLAPQAAGFASLFRYMRTRPSSTLMVPIGVSLLGGSIDVTAQWLPIYLIRSGGMDTGTVGNQVGVIAAAAIIAGPSLTALLLRVHRLRSAPELWVMLTGAILAVLPCLMLLAQLGPRGHLLAFGLLCATACVGSSLWYQVLQRVVPNEFRGQLAALITIIKSLSIGAGITLVGALSDMMPLQLSMGSVSSSMVAISILLLLAGWRGYVRAIDSLASAPRDSAASRAALASA
jgi:MFS family permease